MRGAAADYNEIGLGDEAAGERTPPVIRWAVLGSPFGPLFAAMSDRGLCRLTWVVAHEVAFERELSRRFPDHRLQRDSEGLRPVSQELKEYFQGERRSFDVTIDLVGLTEFQRLVLSAAREVPFGTTVCYSDLARRIGRPRSARAVGNALRANPVPIVIPCHRIVRADGSLGGYGGPHRTGEKHRLLRHEKAEA